MLDLQKQPTTKNMGGLKNVDFEDALNMTGYGKFNYLSLVICSITYLAMGMELFGISFVASAATCDLEMTVAQRGILTAMPLLGNVLGAYPWGYITDIKGRKTTLLLSMTFGFVFSVISSFAPSLTTFAVFKLMAAIFASAANACVYTMLGELQPKKHRDKMLLYLTSAVMPVSALNAAFTYPILTYLNFEMPISFLGISYGPWRILVVILGLPMAFSVFALSWLDESPKFLVSHGKEEEAMKVLRRMYYINTGNPKDTYPVETISFVEENNSTVGMTFIHTLWAQFSPLFHKKYIVYTLCLYYIQFMVYAIANSYSLWMPYIANNFYIGLNAEDAMVYSFCGVVASPDREANDIATGTCDNTINVFSFAVVAAYSIMNCVLNTISVTVIKCVGKKVFNIGLFIFSGICGTMLNWIYNPVAGIILFILFNWGNLAIGTIPAYAVEIYPTYLRGMSLCLLFMIGRLGAIFGTNLLGLMFETHCESSFYILAGGILSSAAVCLFLPKDFKKNSKVFPDDEVTKL